MRPIWWIDLKYTGESWWLEKDWHYEYINQGMEFPDGTDGEQLMFVPINSLTDFHWLAGRENNTKPLSLVKDWLPELPLTFAGTTAS